MWLSILSICISIISLILSILNFLGLQKYVANKVDKKIKQIQKAKETKIVLNEKPGKHRHRNVIYWVDKNGIITSYQVLYKKHWWQFWLPKKDKANGDNLEW